MLFAKSLSKISTNLTKKTKSNDLNHYMFTNKLLEGRGWAKVITSICVYKNKKSIGYLIKNDHDDYPETYLIIKSIN